MNRKQMLINQKNLSKTDKLLYTQSLNLIVTTLLKDIEQLEKSNNLDMNEYTNILKTMSASQYYR